MTKISKKDISVKDPFGDIKTSATEMKSVVVGLKEEFIKLKTELKSIKFKGIDDVEKLASGTSKASRSFNAFNEAQKALSKTEKDRIKLGAKLKEANSDRIQKNVELKVQLQQQNKINKQLAKEVLNGVSAYDRMSKKLAIVRKRFKDVALVEGETSKKAIALRKQIDLLDGKLKRVDASAGQFQRNVGNYPKALASATGALRTFIGAFGLTAGIAGFARLMQNTVKIFADFEQGNVRVASILGVTVKETKALQESAKELGATTARSATEVVKLQEAYARLGFSQSEIIDLQASTIDGSIALNAALEETAELTGAIVNSFDEFETVDAPEIIDQLTLATQRSALNFEKLKVAIPIAAGAASAAKVPFTTFIAQLGQAADRGIDASTSATSLRNIYIELAKKGITLEDALSKINNSQNRLTTANDLFGKRAAVTALALASTTKETEKLDKALQSAGGTAERTADEQLDTLTGASIIFSSAWEGLILKIDDGTASFGTLLKTIVQVGTQILSLLSGTAKATDKLNESEKSVRKIANTIISLAKFVGLLVVAWASYRTTLIAANVATKIAAVLQGGLTKAIQASTAAQKLFSLATKAHPIALVLTALATAVTALRLFSERTDVATESNSLLLATEEDLEKALTETNKALASRLGILGRNTNETDLAKLSISDLKSRLQEANTEFESLTDEFAKEERFKAVQNNFNGIAQSMNRTQLATVSEADALKFLQGELKDEITTIERLLGVKGKDIKKTRELTGLIEIQAKKVSELKKAIDQATGEENIISLKLKLTDAEKELKRLQDLGDKVEKEIKDQTVKRVKAINDTEQLQIQGQIDRINDELTLEETSDERKISLLNARYALQKRALEDQADFILTNDELTAEERETIQQKLMNDIANLEQGRVDDVKTANQKIIDAELALKKKRIDNALDTAKEMTSIFGDAFDEAFEKRLDNLDDEEQATRDNLAVQQGLAENGFENQAEFERQKLAEIEAERRQVAKRRQLVEEGEALALAYLNFVQARAKEDPDTAPVKALQDVATVAVIKGGAKALANLAVGSAYDGTEDTGTIGGGGLDGKGGRLWMLHDNEGVATKDANQTYSGLIGAMNNGSVENWVLQNMATNPSLEIESKVNDITPLEKGLANLSNDMKSVKKAIKDIPQPTELDFDKLGNAMKIRTKNGLKEIVTYKEFSKKI